MLTYRQGTRGGLDLVISLTDDQAAALGVDAAELAEALDTVLVGIAALRTGQDPQVPADATPSLKDAPASNPTSWAAWLIRDTHRLTGRLGGVLAAAIRAHANTGGTYAALAEAMGARRRSSAQRRRDTITGAPPGDAERWATTPAAPTRPHTTDQPERQNPS